MRRNVLSLLPPLTIRRAATRVVPGVLTCAAAALVLTGCVGQGNSPTAVDRTATSTAEPTDASPSTPSTPGVPSTGTPASPPLPAQGASGVEGSTVMSRCPVGTDGPCVITPLTTRVVVTNASGFVAAVDTGADGRFRIALRPGVYTIGATARPAGITRPAAATVTVVAGRYASLTLELDSSTR